MLENKNYNEMLKTAQDLNLITKLQEKLKEKWWTITTVEEHVLRDILQQLVKTRKSF